MRFRPTGFTRRAGMTLIELMVVIVILGIVSAMVIPNLGGSMTTVQLSGAARDMATLMDFCYRDTLATGRVHALVIDADRKRFQIVAEAPRTAAQGSDDPQVAAPEVFDDPQEAPELVPVAIPGFVARSLPEGIKVGQISVVDRELSATKEGEVRLLFFPDGTAEYAALALTDERGDQCVVTLDGLTGMIEVGEPGPAAKPQDEGASGSGGGEA